MRITQIVPSLEARFGGPSRSVRGLSGGLAQNGHVVELITTGNLEESASIENLTIRAFPRQMPVSIARSNALRRHLVTRSQDLIHHHALWQRTLHYAHSAATLSGVPLVLSPRGMMSPWAWNYHRSKKQIASWFIHPGAFAAVDGWHATSEAEADDIRNLGFIQPICVSPNGVLPPILADEQAAAVHWRNACSALAGRRVALFYSRFHSKKRVLELISLWASAPRGDWILLLVGIPEEYSVAQLKAAARNAGAENSMIVADGAGAPMPYAVADLVLLPSHSENFGLVVTEALARGVPVLTTDTTPWAQLDVIGAGHCVPWNRFGASLANLLIEPADTLRARGQIGARWVETEFSWSGAARTLADFYSSLR